MRLWTKIGIGLAAVLISVAAGTTIYAMSGGDDGDKTEQAARDDVDASDEKRSPNDVASICIEGTTDCNDTPTEPGFTQCAEEGVKCGDFECYRDAEGCENTMPAPCPPDYACIEPWLMDPPTCPDGVAIEECFPDGVPAGYDCVTLESFPVQVKCSPIYCGVTTLPAPVDDAGFAPGEPAPSPVEAEELERLREEAPCVLPPEQCDDTSGRCLPPDCTISSDGTIACPPIEDCVGGPAVDCMAPPSEGECVGGPAVDCIAPDFPVECVPGPAVDCYEPNAPQTEPGSGGGSDPEPRDQ